MVELTALIGYYTMVAMTLNAHEIPLPDGAKPPLRETGCGVARVGSTRFIRPSWPGLSRPSTPFAWTDVDARNKSGHDDRGIGEGSEKTEDD